MGKEGTKAEYTCLHLSMNSAFPPQPIHSAFARALCFTSLLPCLLVFPLRARACTAPLVPVAHPAKLMGLSQSLLRCRIVDCPGPGSAMGAGAVWGRREARVRFSALYIHRSAVCGVVR